MLRQMRRVWDPNAKIILLMRHSMAKTTLFAFPRISQIPFKWPEDWRLFFTSIYLISLPDDHHLTRVGHVLLGVGMISLNAKRDIRDTGADSRGASISKVDKRITMNDKEVWRKTSISYRYLLGKSCPEKMSWHLWKPLFHNSTIFNLTIN